MNFTAMAPRCKFRQVVEAMFHVCHVSGNMARVRGEIFFSEITIVEAWPEQVETDFIFIYFLFFALFKVDETDKFP
jgi:hypothetical protein